MADARQRSLNNLIISLALIPDAERAKMLARFPPVDRAYIAWGSAMLERNCFRYAASIGASYHAILDSVGDSVRSMNRFAEAVERMDDPE